MLLIRVPFSGRDLDSAFDSISVFSEIGENQEYTFLSEESLGDIRYVMSLLCYARRSHVIKELNQLLFCAPVLVRCICPLFSITNAFSSYMEVSRSVVSHHIFVLLSMLLVGICST